MKRVFGVSVLALAIASAGSFCSVAFAQYNLARHQRDGASIAAEQQIEQLERDRQQAFVRGDINKLDQETSEDYTTINSSGKLSTKFQMMSNLRAGKTKVESVTLDDLKARVYGDMAILTGRYGDVSVTDGVRKDSHALFTRIFVNTNGHWQAVAYQQTAASAK
jgi:hypothetical protein